MKNARLAHRAASAVKRAPSGKTAQPEASFQRPSFCSQVACLPLPLLKHHNQASIKILRLHVYELLKPKSLKEGRWGSASLIGSLLE